METKERNQALIDLAYEFRQWNRLWDLYESDKSSYKKPINQDKFLENLSKKYTVTKKQ